MVNEYLLNKMGWRHAQPYTKTTFKYDEQVKYFIEFTDKYLSYIIKENLPEEKQKSNFEYKFIIMEYHPDIINRFSKPRPKFKIIEFTNNSDLLKLIIKYEACCEEYKRHFRINKILQSNEKRS
jgi:hypothetical protein